MNDAQVLEIVTGALMMAGKLSAPILVTSLGIGVAISLVQAVTQVQEMTLTFVPKLVGIAVVTIVSGSWMMRELVQWVTTLWTQIPGLTS